MDKKIKKKGTKKVNPSDSNPNKYIRDSKLMPGSGIDKKLATRFFDDMDTEDAAGKGV
tara:strand:+ start:351 stop:524 length:174 start_codon:yes stop_codon:yes gene_type:complete